jgi:hypothetical protein
MDKTNKTKAISFLVPGCMFIGIGIGFIFNAIAVGVMIGLGTGLLLMGIFGMFNSKESNDGKTI